MLCSKYKYNHDVILTKRAGLKDLKEQQSIKL